MATRMVHADRSFAQKEQSCRLVAYYDQCAQRSLMRTVIAGRLNLKICTVISGGGPSCRVLLVLVCLISSLT
jgi:hypothetical protein